MLCELGLSAETEKNVPDRGDGQEFSVEQRTKDTKGEDVVSVVVHVAAADDGDCTVGESGKTDEEGMNTGLKSRADGNVEDSAVVDLHLSQGRELLLGVLTESRIVHQVSDDEGALVRDLAEGNNPSVLKSSGGDGEGRDGEFHAFGEVGDQPRRE